MWILIHDCDLTFILILCFPYIDLLLLHLSFTVQCSDLKMQISLNIPMKIDVALFTHIFMCIHMLIVTYHYNN